MALQTKANTGTGTDVLATDFIAGEHFALSKIAIGDLGATAGAVGPNNPLPSQMYQGTTPVAAGNELQIQNTQSTGLYLRDALGNLLGAGGQPFPVANNPTAPLAITVRPGGAANTIVNPVWVDGKVALLDAGGIPYQASNPIPHSNIVGGLPESLSNPQFVTLSQAGLALSNSNALPIQNKARDVTTAGPFTVLNTDLLSGVVGAWVDATGANELLVTIIGSVGITSGAITFEGTNSPTLAPNGALISVEEPSSGAFPVRAALGIAANAVRNFRVPITSRFIRIRISTAFAGGTIRAVGFLRENAATGLTYTNIPTATVNVNGTPNVISFKAAFGTIETSSAKTVSGVGALQSNLVGTSGVVFTHNISALTGTAPTVQLKLQVQDPVTGLFGDLPGAVFPIRNAVGLYTTIVCPGLALAPDILSSIVPRNYRVACTITGTTPSATFSIGASVI